MNRSDEPRRGETVEREREVIGDRGWRAQLEDQLRSIRNALFGVGLVALLGLALGVYLLATRDDDGSGRDGASSSQVRDLEDRVDELESRVDNRASESDLKDLQESQSQISDRLDTLEQQAEQGRGGDTQQLEQAIDDLSSDLEELSQRVDELEQQQQEQQQ